MSDSVIEGKPGALVLQAALDALPAQVVVLDAAGVILATNAAWQQRRTSLALFGRPDVGPGANYLGECRQARGPGRQALAAAARALEELLREARGSMVQTCPSQGSDSGQSFILRATRVVGAGPEAVVVSHQELGDYWALDKPGRGSESESRRRADVLQRALDAIADAVIVVDREGKFVLFNAPAERLQGMGTTDLSPAEWRDAYGVFASDGRTPVPSNQMPLARALRGENIDGFEGFLRNPQAPAGVWVSASARPLLDMEGRLIGGVAVVRDVSEQRRAEAMLRLQEGTNRALLDAIPDLICRLGRDGALRSLNVGRDFGPAPPLSRLFGLTLQEIRERWDLPPAEVVEDAMRALERALRTGETQFFEYRLAFRGDVRVYDARLVVSGTDEVLAIVRDVTERRRVEARLELSARMVSVGSLAAGVAHEVNNPLTYILSNLSFVEKELEQVHESRPLERIAELREWLADARSGAQQVESSVKALKTFAEAQEHRSGPVDLVSVLEDALRLTANELRHRATVLRRFADAPSVWGAPGRLLQVFVQLLLNAAESLPEGRAEEHRVEVEARREGTTHVVVEIRDTGRGIAEEVMGRIFDPFFTTKGLGEGTGLGLTICHNHLAAMGGEIAVHPRDGGGTTVAISLPTAPPPRAPLRSPAPGVPPLKVLVVDDEPAISRSLRQALFGHEVTVALSGREAIELLERGRHFDAIVCDLIMSDKTGADVYQACAGRGDGLEQRLLFVTGGAFTAGARDFLASTANPWLEKPFDLREFRRCVEALATQ